MGFFDKFKQGAAIGSDEFIRHSIRPEKAKKDVYKRTTKLEKNKNNSKNEEKSM